MFDLVLYEPEIPPNTGNVMRLGVDGLGEQRQRVVEA